MHIKGRRAERAHGWWRETKAGSWPRTGGWVQLASATDGARCLGLENTSPRKVPNLCWLTTLQNASRLKSTSRCWFRKVIFILKDEDAYIWSCAIRGELYLSAIGFSPQKELITGLSPLQLVRAPSSDHPRHGESLTLPVLLLDQQDGNILKGDLNEHLEEKLIPPQTHDQITIITEFLSS